MEKMSLEEQSFWKSRLADAISNNNREEIVRISRILNVPEEQIKFFNQGLTGYPSIDQVWLSKYRPTAYEEAMNYPKDLTVWDFIEQKLMEYYDIPAIEYFKKIISREEFVESCYTWARTFRAMGVEPDEVVPVYGPVVPDICAMTLALIMIGACPYFLKLSIDPESLEKETRESKIAVVFDDMWTNVADEFSKDKFKNVIVATATADMPSPTKEIVSFLSYFKAKKQKSLVPNEKKYIWTDKAKDISNYYSGTVKVPFVPNRPAIITSSSGTTVGGVVKGVVATNESIIAQVYSGTKSEIPYYPGDRVLNHFPFTASTSLNSLFLLALYNGMTVLVDPRVSENDFYNQIMTLKPNIALTTGSAWEAFFNRVIYEMSKGKKFDFSFAKGWTIGGEGTDPKKFRLWNEIMKMCGAEGIYTGYGLSELFSAVSVEKVDSRCDFSKPMMSVGLPQAGMTVGIFDKDGKELSYEKRGELWIQSDAAAQGYYDKPELTEKTFVDGWVRTGDLASIDENGFLYVWGRTKDKIVLPDNGEVYLFDIANKIKEMNYINDAIVLPMPTDNNPYSLVAHIVFDEKNMIDRTQCINELNRVLSEYLPSPLEVVAYSEYETMLPYSPTTLKKDKNLMAKKKDGYIQVIDDKLNKIEFIPNENGTYSQKYDIINNSKAKVMRIK